mmetsp:Transcript_15580/g.25805  ORF Transcript_15580/g.25805 Transcript_15580/m.25805 type:complete len:454 (+) Transcript_15580:79-1440(+)
MTVTEGSIRHDLDFQDLCNSCIEIVFPLSVSRERALRLSQLRRPPICFVDNVPEDILWQVFARLTEMLNVLRVVCSSWRRVVDENRESVHLLVDRLSPCSSCRHAFTPILSRLRRLAVLQVSGQLNQDQLADVTSFVSGNGLLERLEIVGSKAALQHHPLDRSESVYGRMIASALEASCPSLTFLGLAHLQLGDDGLCAILSSLEHSRCWKEGRLKELNLDGNNASYKTLEHIAFLVCHKHQSLERVSLENNPIGTARVGMEVEYSPAPALQTLFCLKSLKLAQCSLVMLGRGPVLPSPLPRANVEVLDLSGNYFGSIGCDFIASSLTSTLGNVCHLDLSENGIGEDGCRSLAEVLVSNRALSRLNLQGNFVLDEGAASIAEALRSNTTLQYLNLASNGICDYGVRALVGVLLMPQLHLRELDMGMNSFSSFGGDFLDICASIRTDYGFVTHW